MTKQEYFAAIAPHYSGYQELHTHTDASFNDAVTTVPEIVAKAKEYGRNAFAITDHGNQMRLFHGFKARTNAEKDALEIYVDSGTIILKKYAPSCVFCGDTRGVVTYKGKNICSTCMRELKRG